MNGIDWSGTNVMRQNGLLNTGTPMPQITPSVPQLPILSVIYVENGRQGAIDYPTPPNCPGIPIFDKYSNTLFIKSTDSYGNVAQLLEYEVNPKKSEADKQNEILSAIVARMDRIEEMVQNGTKPDNAGVTEQPTASTTIDDRHSKRNR